MAGKKTETKAASTLQGKAAAGWMQRFGLILAVAAAVVAAWGLSTLLGPGSSPPAIEEKKVETEGLPKPDVSLEELLKPGPLGDHVIGDANAPVTIVEYASMTCPHCARFHANVYPELKKKYIDTGKARLIFREFPLDDLATAVSALAHCAGPTRYFPFVATMFERQDYWASNEPLPKLLEMAKQAGFTDEQFNSCLTDQKLVDGIHEVRKRGDEVFKVNSTPTVFVNGVRMENLSIEEFDKVIGAFLKG